MAEDIEEDFNEEDSHYHTSSRAERRCPLRRRIACQRENSTELLAMLYALFKLAKCKGDLALESHVERTDESPYFTIAKLTDTERYFVADSLRLMTLGTSDSAAFRRLHDLAIQSEWFLMPWRRARLVAAAAAMEAHADGYAPQVSVEFGRRAMPSWMRPSFFEVEETITNLPA